MLQLAGFLKNTPILQLLHMHLFVANVFLQFIHSTTLAVIQIIIFTTRQGTNELVVTLHLTI